MYFFEKFKKFCEIHKIIFFKNQFKKKPFKSLENKFFKTKLSKSIYFRSSFTKNEFHFSICQKHFTKHHLLCTAKTNNRSSLVNQQNREKVWHLKLTLLFPDVLVSHV